MKKFFQKQREIITVFTYIIVVAGLVYFVILTLLEKIDGLNNQIQEGSLKQVIVKQQIEELPKIKQQYDTLQKNEGQADVLLDKDKAVILIENLEKLAQDSDNQIEISIQNSQLLTNTTAGVTKTTTDNDLISKLPSADYLQMQIVLTGDYNKIVDFISKLENMEYYSDIIGININQGERAPEIGTANPFSPNNTENNQVSEPTVPKDLKATLDIVFYIKNNSK